MANPTTTPFDKDAMMDGWFSSPASEPRRRCVWCKRGRHKKMARCDREAVPGHRYCRQHLRSR